MLRKLGGNLLAMLALELQVFKGIRALDLGFTV